MTPYKHLNFEKPAVQFSHPDLPEVPLISWLFFHLNLPYWCSLLESDSHHLLI